MADHRFNGGWTPDGDAPLRITDDYIAIEFDLAEAIRGPEWFVDAACRHKPNDDGEIPPSLLNVFFPENSAQGGNQLAEPRSHCLACPVRAKCLEYGLNEPFGVWGGHSLSQRRRIQSLVKNGSTLEEASRQIDARSRDARR